MKTELVSIISTDRLVLPGLLYSPLKPSNKVAVWLHGMGDNGIFYNPERINTLGAALTSTGIALLAFNNRGAHNAKSLRYDNQELAELPDEDHTYQGGTYYEKIIDCLKDIEGATAYLAARNFTEFYLLGHSTGANKICAYHVRAKHNPFSKYVLAGPADDIGTAFTRMGAKKFRRAIDYAEQAINAGQPLRIMPHYTAMYPFSAQSALDILHPEGAYNTFPFYEYTTQHLSTKPLFKEYRTIDKPMLVIFGTEDEYAFTAGNAANALEILRDQTPKSILKQSDFSLIPNTDHGFHGSERVFAEKTASWLTN